VVRERPNRSGAAGVDDGGTLGLTQVRQHSADAVERTQKLTRQLFSKADTVSSASEARCNTPALFTNVVSDPNRSITSAAAACHCSSDVTSSGIAIAPSPPTDSTVTANSSTSRSQAATRNPSSGRR
jgi:hypothetical protein